MATRKTKTEDSQKVIIQEKREVELPGPPDVPAGKMAFRMVYKNGKFRDIIGDSRFDCTGKAKKQATADHMNFLSNDILKFDKIA